MNQFYFSLRPLFAFLAIYLLFFYYIGEDEHNCCKSIHSCSQIKNAQEFRCFPSPLIFSLAPQDMALCLTCMTWRRTSPPLFIIGGPSSKLDFSIPLKIEQLLIYPLQQFMNDLIFSLEELQVEVKKTKNRVLEF